jgi:hypothetical protein
MVSACDYIVQGLLEHNKETKKIKKIPAVQKQKIEMLAELYKDDNELLRFITFTVFLRELIKARFTKREEYRRHVTMVAELRNQTAEVNIDVLEDNYDVIAKKFLEYAEILAGLRKADD